MARDDDWQAMHALCDEMIEGQSQLLLRLGRRVVPTLTPEDMLQPNDYPELENHPQFRYEEGLLAGIQALKSALLALRKDRQVRG
jgi:hypothetical protein